VIEETIIEQAPKKKRGFGAMSPERQKMIAALGGKAVKPENRSFSQNRDLARSAGSIGGKCPRKKATDHGTEAPVA
jgi:general stress protein YciG